MNEATKTFTPWKLYSQHGYKYYLALSYIDPSLMVGTGIIWLATLSPYAGLAAMTTMLLSSVNAMYVAYVDRPIITAFKDAMHDVVGYNVIGDPRKADCHFEKNGVEFDNIAIDQDKLASFSKRALHDGMRSSLPGRIYTAIAGRPRMPQPSG